MRILLITTGQNNNPGDQFIRLGVETLIRSVWPHDQSPPELIRVDKESDEISQPQFFDRAIVCGMPLWWNNDVSTSQSIGWWGPLFRGWIAEDRRKLLVLGAGPVVGKAGLKDDLEFFNAVEETTQRAWCVTSRQPLPVPAPGVLDSICPATFAAQYCEAPTRKLCNLMPAGSHDEHFDPEAAAEWKRRLPDVSQALLEGGFEFIAHSEDEYKLAYKLGWPADRILFPTTPEQYLKAYAETKVFFGNRLHGAMMAATSGGVAVAVGYDSRMEMLKPFTPHTWGPFGVPTRNLAPMLEGLTPRLNRPRLSHEYVRCRDIVAKFLSLPSVL